MAIKDIIKEKRSEGKEYLLYHYEQYNCNDPLGGLKHGHVRMKVKDIYFNSPYGIIAVRNSGKHYELLSSIKEIHFPSELTLAFLKNEKPEKIIYNIYSKETTNAVK